MSLLIENELSESSSVISSIDPEQIRRIVDALIGTFRDKKKVVLFGNGGSASDAQHLAGRVLWKICHGEAGA